MAKKNTLAPVATDTLVTENAVQTVLALAHASGLEVEEQSSFYKIARDRKALYISKSKRALARIDLAGFSLNHEAVQQLSAEEAKVKKLGKVRGQIFPKTASANWQDAVVEALRILNDGTPGIKLERGASVDVDMNEEAVEMAADEQLSPRGRRRRRSTRIPVL